MKPRNAGCQPAFLESKEETARLKRAVNAREVLKFAQ